MLATAIKALSSIGPIALGLLVDAAIKGMLVLALTAVLALSMRRASAAARHLAWFLGAAALLLLPALSLTLPGWRVRGQWTAPLAVPLRLAAPETQRLSAPGQSSAPMQPAMDGTAVHAGSWQGWVLAAWSAGAMLLLARMAMGWLSLHRLQRRSRIVADERWLALLGEIKGDLGIGRPVALLQSDLRAMPMTWGLWHVRVLLPRDCNAWTQTQRRAVLWHELAHARRQDCLTQLVAQIALALHWFNPLMWLAWQQMQIEREQACDDRVLAGGTRASSYADELLRIAAETSLPGWSAAIGMARPGRLERRLVAILDGTRNRRVLSRRAAMVAVLLLGVCAVPLAMVRAADNAAGTQPDSGKTEHAEADARGDAPATRPAAYLDFRIAVVPHGAEGIALSEADEKAALKNLAAEGPTAFKTYRWFPIDPNPGATGGLLTGTSKGQAYVLLCDSPDHTLLASRRGARTWGLEKVYVTQDGAGHPGIGFNLDKAGAQRLGKLTESHLHQCLVVLVDDKVVAAPRIQTKLGQAGMISGRFTTKEVADMVRVLRHGMTPDRARPGAREAR